MLKRYFGPSTLVTAAFIGPGTVTVCTLAGVSNGYQLLWALLFSVAATFILQEMTARLGLVSQNGFGEAIRAQITQPVTRLLAIALVLGAIVIGNTAYEGGNISGAALGFEELAFSLTITVNTWQISVIPLLIGVLAWLVLRARRLQLIENMLIGLVALMSVVFCLTAVLVRPDWSAIMGGLFLPSASGNDWLTVIALVGTTVVPYNLFLHASLVKSRYSAVAQLPDLRQELAVSVALGGLISIAIVITSAATLQGASDVSSAADMAVQLEPLLGGWASVFLGLGLLAAGLSSAITAPLAAAFASRGILGWDDELDSPRMQWVIRTILLFGVLVSSLGISPVAIIRFAQAANGLLLPIVAIFLLLLMNRPALLGNQINKPVQNLLGGFVILVTVVLGLRSLGSVFGFL